MKNNLFYSLLAICISTLFSCQQTPEAPVAAATAETPAPPDMAAIKAEIQTIENTWAVASSAKDVATIVGFYADDAISMNDDQPMLMGKAAIQKVVEEEMAKHKENRTVAFETMEVYGDENRVTEVGKTTVTDASGKVVYGGKYMAVWEKRNGKWLTIRDISNDDKKEE